MPVSTGGYYSEYHGHPVEDLEEVVRSLRQQGKTIIWTAGDSSLDNKYWFRQAHDAVNGYEHILQPPRMKADVTYWLNKHISDQQVPDLACVNTAIEATSLNDRAFGHLLAQDKIIRDYIGPDDYLIVSVGGNDVALQPVLCTVCSMFALVYCPIPTACIKRTAFACPPNTGVVGDCGCFGCGVPNCISSLLCGWPLGFPYMVDLFKNRVSNYVNGLVSRTKPRKVIVCMIYHLDEVAAGSWADSALCCLCYNCNPERLQAGIEMAYKWGTSKISIPGTEVLPFPLFKVLNGKNSADYCQRVEPSPQGGEKMAAALLGAVLGQHRFPSSSDESTPGSAPEQEEME
eukprot:TRINITY_DN56957_c0_g1_i2.p1 TRINITY_DN56957_c0_g1~~TRINITY_DN56957_c0_g1_i2.p1  ORF type:complete len:345 (+),score=69.53 TRINITY_DN56957_c0_g1_i2:85-1119(+)